MRTCRASVRGAFDLQNPLAAKAAKAHGARLVREVSEETKRAIAAVVERSFADAIAPRELARIIRPLIGLTTRHAQAVLTAHAKWIAAGLAPEIAAKKAATYAGKLLRERALTIARTECLPGETLVDSAVASAAYRRWYAGPLVEIVTSDGRKLSATPNHPMLTRCGWLAAGDVQEGDDLIGRGWRQEAGATGDEDIQAPPAPIREIFDALATVGLIERKRGGQPDFHGDGMEGEIDVLVADRMLAVGSFAPLYEPVVQAFLAPADAIRAPICHGCRRLLSVDQQQCFCERSERDTSINQVPTNDARGASQRDGDGGHRFASGVASDDSIDINVAAVVRGLSSAGEKGRTSFAQRASRSGVSDRIEHPVRIATDAGRDLSRAQSGTVQLDRVIAVFVRAWAGHVYNLSTPYGYFTANGFYTGNSIRAANAGRHAAWARAVDKGLLIKARTRRIWLAGGDLRVCARCEKLHKTTATMDGTFYGGILHPPLHPRCRCSVALIFDD